MDALRVTELENIQVKRERDALELANLRLVDQIKVLRARLEQLERPRRSRPRPRNGNSRFHPNGRNNHSRR